MRHIARSQEGNEAATLATWAAVLAAIIAGSANPDVVIGALSVGQALTYQRQVNYTRAHEQEADRIGIQTLASAGFDPEGMASFFVRLQQQSRLYGSGVPEILRTHPLNTSRIAEARARIAALPKVKREDPLDFGLMQARARVMAADNLSQAVEYFDAEIASGNDSVPHRYGLSYALLERGQYDEALAALEPALKRQPRQVNLNLLKGRIQLSLRQTDAALGTLERTLKLYPGHAPAIFAYADGLMLAGRPEEARQVLISHEQVLGTRLQTYSLLAQAARDMKQHGESAYQMGNYLFRRGDAGGALAQLDAGLRIADLSKQERARLLAKRQEIRDSLPQDWRPPTGERAPR
jgi:beta-barrel assembly-enhancing protease